MNTVKTCINETNKKYGQGLTCSKYIDQKPTGQNLIRVAGKNKQVNTGHTKPVSI